MPGYIAIKRSNGNFGWIRIIPSSLGGSFFEPPSGIIKDYAFQQDGSSIASGATGVTTTPTPTEVPEPTVVGAILLTSFTALRYGKRGGQSQIRE